MKRLLSMFVVFSVLLFCIDIVYADDRIYLNYIEDGTLLDYNQNVAYSYGTGIFMVTVIYVDSSGNVLEAFVNDGGRLSGENEYANGSFASFYVGETCKEAYLRFSEISSTDGVENWCDKVSIYSSGYDLSLIKYWNKYSLSRDDIISYCTNSNEMKKSYICLDVINGSSQIFSGPMFMFKEYAPVSFELVCEPKEVKKGDTSNCSLVINADEEINEITIPMNSELFDIDKYNEVDGWELVVNQDGTITLKSENGFSGNGVVLGATLKFKEDLTDNIEIELNDINYTTTTGMKLNASAKESVTIFEEPEVEVPDIKEENPNTFDNIKIVILISIFCLLVFRRLYSMKKV